MTNVPGGRYGLARAIRFAVDVAVFSFMVIMVQWLDHDGKEIHRLQVANRLLEADLVRARDEAKWYRAAAESQAADANREVFK